MKEQNMIIRKNNKNSTSIKRFLYGKLLIGILIILVSIVVIIGIKKYVDSFSKTTKIGFEDIGELATQSAYCTEVNVTDASRQLFGVNIPFTQSKYIYSYNIIIKAGFDFKEIKWEENGSTIEVELPETKIISCEINMDSFELYHEDESIFRQITMTENSEAIKEMKEKAEKDAIENGLLDNARSNAETILTSFFASEYDLNKYKVVFKNK